MKSIIVSFIGCCISFNLFSCQLKRVIELKMNSKNPTEYVFNTPIKNMHALIKKANGYITKGGFILSYKNNFSSYVQVSPNISTTFNHDSAKYDFFLNSYGPFCFSKIYIKSNGDSLKYSAGFFIHLDSIDINKTKASIITYKPHIEIGESLLPLPPHGAHNPFLRHVNPSTLEEFEILLRIGFLLGENNMPPLILPDPDIKKGRFVKLKKYKQ